MGATIELTEEAQATLGSNQREGETLRETLHRILTVIPRDPAYELAPDSSFALLRGKGPDGEYQTNLYKNGYVVYEELDRVIHEDGWALPPQPERGRRDRP